MSPHVTSVYSTTALRSLLKSRPTCEERVVGRAYCPKIAVSAALVRPEAVTPEVALSPRCPEHAPPEAPRLCTGCGRLNGSRHPWHCGACEADEEIVGW